MLMKNVIITLPFLLLAVVTEAQQATDADNIKRKLIQNDTQKYVEEGGTLNDALIRKPVKKQDIYGDGFIIHKQEYDRDYQIHQLNGISDQCSDHYQERKSKSLIKMNEDSDPRRIESFEGDYKTPLERSSKIKKQ
jgi:hypothetical protein